MPAIKRKQNKSSNTNTISTNFVKAQLICFAVYIAIFLLICGVCIIADSGDNGDVYFSLIAFAFASFLSGLIGGNKTRKKGILSGLIYGTPSNLLVIFASLTANSFKPDIRLLVSAVVLTAACAVGGIVGVNMRHRR